MEVDWREEGNSCGELSSRRGRNTTVKCWQGEEPDRQDGGEEDEEDQVRAQDEEECREEFREK